MKEDGFDLAAGAGWAAVEVAFTALGRVLLLLDGAFRVLRATQTLDAWVCPGAAQRLPGHPVEDLLGVRLFGSDATLRAALEQGTREEGWRALVQCSQSGGARLASFSAVLLPEHAGAWAAGARYMVVLRPAEEDDLILESALATHGIVGHSQAMRNIVQRIGALHRSDATVLITGESGTGKEIVARALHADSPRRSAPFVAINCGALPAELLESELFGHVRGAFTGAVRDRVGRFESAQGGVLFLDEIGDMPPPLQVKLLRVLQERRFERVGESASRSMDVRLIAATHVDLKERIVVGRFREDLYYRLRVVPIHIPPLRERAEDIEPLARHILSCITAREDRAARLSSDAMRALVRYTWPGNVRELENTIEYAVALCQRQTIQLEDLPPEIATNLEGQALSVPAVRPLPNRGARPSSPEGPASEASRQALPGLHDDEAARIRAALEAHRWHHARTAAGLGMSRTTLWRKMRALGLT